MDKLEVKKKKAAEQVEDLIKKVNAPNYETKVKVDVREANSAKVRYGKNTRGYLFSSAVSLTKSFIFALA